MQRPALLVLLLMACGRAAQAQDSVRVRIVQHMEQTSIPYTPPPEYAAWWRDVAALCDCAPKVSFATLQWARVDTPVFVCDVMATLAAR